MALFGSPQRSNPVRLWNRRGSLCWTFLLISPIVFIANSKAADVDDVAELLRKGEYAECSAAAALEIEHGARGDLWYRLKIEADLARGEYQGALATLEEALGHYRESLRLFLLGREVRRINGLGDRDSAAMETILRTLRFNPARYASSQARVDLGRFFLLRGADPKQVLERFYNPVIKDAPEFADAYFASAELAIDKQDFELAAETLRKAPKEARDNPRFHYLMALAFSEDDRQQTAKAIDEALKINPKHLDSLLLKADGLVDAEQYAEALKVVDQVLDVNPHEPRGWAFRAVVGHLKGNAQDEANARREALSVWDKNPDVDLLIGRKLSQKYRFAEGAVDLRRALELDPNHLPTKIQLCQTLLRLGEEAEGWRLANEVFTSDAYNVVAYNLTTLHDRINTFRTMEADGLLVRMDPHEADLYGSRVLDLLREAKTRLSEKYGVALPSPLIVEIFPRKKEFAVRTFGLPGADGLLGVCFGKVITANSPASQGEHPSNWEAVLWHELCHSITLTKSRNKMPRWLSEGISVYEEEKRDPAWVGALTPRFREMILSNELTPLSRLSSAFLAPKSSMHLQFAYRESALAVEFLVEKGGLPALLGLLDDLGAGKSLEDSLPQRAQMTLEQLDAEFARFAKAKATTLNANADWTKAELPDGADSSKISEWLTTHPRNFWGRQRLAQALIAEKKWAEAKTAALALLALDPNYVGPENAYTMLAKADKQLNDPAAEYAILDGLAGRSSDETQVFLRLMELDEAKKDWKNLEKNARRMLAVNPLVPTPHRLLAMASETLGHREQAIDAFRALASIDIADPSEIHYHLAKLLHESGRDTEARREVLKALDDAPRYFEAHRLLLELPNDPNPAGRAAP